MPETYRGRGVRHRNRYAAVGKEKKSFSKKVLFQSVCAIFILFAVYLFKGVDNQSVKVVREQIKLTLSQTISIPSLERFFGGENVDDVEQPDEFDYADPGQDELQDEPDEQDFDAGESIPVNIDDEDDIIVQL